MRNIKSVVIVAFTALSLFVMAPASFAGNGKGLGQGTGDGTGPIHNIIDDADLLLSADQTRTRDRKKDDSCQNPIIETMTDALILAKGGHGNGSGKGGKGGHHGPGNGTGNGGNGPKDGSGNGSKSGTCKNA